MEDTSSILANKKARQAGLAQESRLAPQALRLYCGWFCGQPSF
jgi:hypothetical protein